MHLKQTSILGTASPPINKVRHSRGHLGPKSKERAGFCANVALLQYTRQYRNAGLLQYLRAVPQGRIATTPHGIAATLLQC